MDFQKGLSNETSMRGKILVCIFSRWNFLLLATNQISNHLDKIKKLAQLSTLARVIIPRGIDSETPLHPGPQHTGDITDAFRPMCRNTNIVRLNRKEDIVANCREALERKDGVSTILDEWSYKFGD